jgi:hypothetical protein
MGNNMTALLQLPRTYFFLSTSWDYEYRKRSQRDVLLEDLAGHLYSEHAELIADGFSALDATDPQKIADVLEPLERLIQQGQLGRPGVIGRKIFPDQRQVAGDLVFQIKDSRSAATVIAGTVLEDRSR